MKSSNESLREKWLKRAWETGISIGEMSDKLRSNEYNMVMPSNAINSRFHDPIPQEAQWVPLENRQEEDETLLIVDDHALIVQVQKMEPEIDSDKKAFRANQSDAFNR